MGQELFFKVTVIGLGLSVVALVAAILFLIWGSGAVQIFNLSPVPDWICTAQLRSRHPSGDFVAEEYRAYFVGRDGHFNGFEPLVCADDAAEIDLAKRLVNKFGIEIWSGARLVVRLRTTDDQ